MGVSQVYALFPIGTAVGYTQAQTAVARSTNRDTWEERVLDWVRKRLEAVPPAYPVADKQARSGPASAFEHP
jgi:hypothetical protein